VKKYLIAGLLVWLPLALTVWVLHLAAGRAGRRVPVAAVHRRPCCRWPPRRIEALRRIPGLGVIVLVALLLGTGVFATNIFGQWWLRQWHRLLNRIPIVKSIYNSVKQVSDTLFSSSGNAFREAVLVQYPPGMPGRSPSSPGKPGGEVRACQPVDHAQPVTL
jgi:uncharacterized membrane protein